MQLAWVATSGVVLWTVEGNLEPVADQDSVRRAEPMGTTSGRPVVQRVGCKPTSESDGMVPSSNNKRVEPMTRSAITFIPNPPAVGALLVMAH